MGKRQKAVNLLIDQIALKFVLKTGGGERKVKVGRQ